MTIDQCYIARSGRTATIAPKNNHTYTETYYVKTNDEYWGPGKVVFAAQGLTRTATTAPVPNTYEAYVEYDGMTPIFTDLGAVAMQITASQSSDDPHISAIRATYRQFQPGEDPADDVSNPLNLPVKYWIEYADKAEIVRTAVNLDNDLGQFGGTQRLVGTLGPVVNGALQDFDEPLEEIVRRVFFIAEQPISTIQAGLDFNREFEGTMNDALWYGWAEGHAAFAGADVSQLRHLNGIPYYMMTMRIEINTNGFDFDAVNRGYKWYEATGELTKEFAPEPELLNIFGEKLGPGVLGETIRYRTKTLKDYSLLGIGS